MNNEIEELKLLLQRREDELRIVYQLADAMYATTVYGTHEGRFKATSDYYDWVHAGELVEEDINDL